MIMIACAGDAPSSPNVPNRPSITSSSWAYRYSEPGYSEGLDSVRGVLKLSRVADTLWISAPRDVIGYFWAQTPDTAGKFVARIWPTGYTFVARTSQSGDTLRVTSANANIWPAYGYYILVQDGADFAWIVQDSIKSIELHIMYR